MKGPPSPRNNGVSPWIRVLLAVAAAALGPPATSSQCSIMPPMCCFESSYPSQYVGYYTDARPSIDGVLDEDLWAEVGWTDLFQDILGRGRAPPPRFETRAKMRWDDDFLYIGAFLQEPQVWANVTQDNTVIFNDNDFEVFVDPAGSTHGYKEFEMNANAASWRLALNKPYRNGGYENSTRVFAEHGWCSATVDGKINDPTEPARSWTVEIALPLISLMFNNTQEAPSHGTLWRIDFSRVEWKVAVVDGHYVKTGGSEDNWVWSRIGEVDMHMPERWGLLQFSTGLVNTTAVERDATWTVRHVAFALFYAQAQYLGATGTYAGSVEQLIIFAEQHTLDGTCTSVPTIRVSEGSQRYSATVVARDGSVVASIRDDRRIIVKRLLDDDRDSVVR